MARKDFRDAFDQVGAIPGVRNMDNARKGGYSGAVKYRALTDSVAYSRGAKVKQVEQKARKPHMQPLDKNRYGEWLEKYLMEEAEKEQRKKKLTK